MKYGETLMTRSRWFYQAFVVILLAALALPMVGLNTAHADGLILIGGVYRQPQVSHITVKIESKIATTTLEQTFSNPLDKQVNAVYVAPVPPGATVTGFAQLIDGAWIEAEVKEKETAKKEFDEAAKQGKEAAMASGSVTAIDPTMTFQTEVILPPNAERSVRLTYTEVLIGTVGLTRYVYPLSHTKMTAEPVGDLLVKVEIKEGDEIRAVYSPSHQNAVEVARDKPNEAVALYRAQNITPDRDFELVYTQSSEKFGLNLASYRDGKDKDGYFVLIAAPQAKVDQSEVIAKDFVFVLDRSGSMSGEKFIQAQKALKRILDALNPEDRFTIVSFDNGVETYHNTLRTMDYRDDARAWVDSRVIGGGTNINDSLQTAIRTVDQTSERPHIIVFLTDGQATEGVTDTAAILANVRENIKPQSRVYTIGIGDVNQPLLESLASENRGTSLFVNAYDPLEKPLADFYAAIDSPVLVDLALDFGSMKVYDLNPHPIPDMFLGGQVVISGRYKGGGTTTITLTGKINGEVHTSVYQDIKFIDPSVKVSAPENAANSYVPRMWAQRKADALVRKMAIEGPDPKLVEEVTKLGETYKIITPYTAFVVTAPKSNNGGQPIAGLPATGLPFLDRDDFRSLNTALMILGAIITLGGLLGLVITRVRK